MGSLRLAAAAGAFGFLLGTLAGYLAGSHRPDTRPRPVPGTTGEATAASAPAEGSPGTVPPTGISMRNRPVLHMLQPAGKAGGEGDPDTPEPPNPFLNEPLDRLIEVLNKEPRGEEGEERFRLAVSALAQRSRWQGGELGSQLFQIRRPEAIHAVCRALVRFGGEEGIQAVSQYVLDPRGGLDCRREAALSLAGAPPQQAGPAREALRDLMTRVLPPELQHALCNAYGESAGTAAFSSLLHLLDDPSLAVRPEIVIETAGRFGKPGKDVETLLGLLGGTWTGEAEVAILRSAARAAGSGGVLLDLIADPPPGINVRSAARALAGAAGAGAVDTQKLLSVLESSRDHVVRTELARALIRSGGEQALNGLLEMAQDPTSGIDSDTLGAALIEAPRPQFINTMLDLLSTVRQFDIAHGLTEAIITAGGRSAVDRLIGLIEQGALTGKPLFPVAASLAEAASSQDAERLLAAAASLKDPEASWALLKASARAAPAVTVKRCRELLQASENEQLRAAAADILGHLRPGEFVTELSDALARERSEHAQRFLARALVESGKEGIARLVQFMAGEGNAERKHAILDAFFDRPERPPEGALSLALQTLFRDPDPSVRAHAAKLLSHIHTAEDLPALREAFARETDPEVREILQAALTGSPAAQ